MSPVAAVKTLKIDGRDFSGRQEETILDVARQNGIFIPRLCEMDGLSDVGACRLCLVEIKGQNKLLPACVTAVEEGMEVTTDSERLQSYRRMILELLFTERNHVCSVCVSNGHCELQMLAQRLGITHVHFPYRYPKEEWTRRTTASSSTTTAASCARAACGSATKSRARIPGT